MRRGGARAPLATGGRPQWGRAPPLSLTPPSPRSAIFTHSPEQLAAATAKIRALDASGSLRGPVVTALADAGAHEWFPAESYHQGYCKANPEQGYVRAVSLPKAAKVRREFPQLFR